MKGYWVSYLPVELAWIEANCRMSRVDLHAAFCARFARDDVTVENIKSLCSRKGWKSANDGRFALGQAPANKGKTMPFNANSARTQFKKGQRPANKHDVGYESIDKEGYVKICVAEPNPWTGAPTHMAYKHRWLWEQANGPVPAGMALKCLDSNKQNTDPSNWEAIPKALLPRLAGRWKRPYDDAPAEIKPTLLAIAKLAHCSRKAKRREAANG